MTEKVFWCTWVTAHQIGPEGQCRFRGPELDQARLLGYKVAMTEWNWNGWWGRSIREKAALNSLFAKGVGAAGILHAIMRQGDVVKLATQSMLIGDGWGIHAIWCDRTGRTPPFMVPSGQVTMLYSKYHGDQRLRIDVANMPRYDQPYRMAGIGPAHQAACLDILATRSEDTHYLHVINRDFDRTLSTQLDLSDLDQHPAATATLHILEGRLHDTRSGVHTSAPAQIRHQTVKRVSDRFTIPFPRRSVTVVEIPLQSD